MTKKLKLDQLNVKSFTTSDETQSSIRGGTQGGSQFLQQCSNECPPSDFPCDDTEHCEWNTLITTSDGPC